MPDMVAQAKLYNGLMRKGDGGDAVWAAKQRLFALGMYSTKITELKSKTLGNDSIAAIKRFQIKNGLKVDGVIGEETWGALFGAYVGAPVADDLGVKVSDPVIELMRQIAQTEVDNGSIYVWASSGELGTSVNEAWIQKKENRNNGGANFGRAFALWLKRITAGNRLFRCFDCSGFVSWVLTKAGVFSGRRDCDGLYSLCKPLDEPKDGCLLFRVNKNNYEDETHVGLYFNGYQYHSKGRDDGVVCEKYKASYWAKMAWWKALG